MKLIRVLLTDWRKVFMNRVAVLVLSGVIFAMTSVSSFGALGTLPDFTDIVEKNSPAVVKINTVQEPSHGSSPGRGGLPPGYDPRQWDQLPELFRRLFEQHGKPPSRGARSLGSGFIISADGYVLTNNHVVDGADKIIVRLIDRREFEAEVIGTDERSDLALLKVEAEGLPTVEFGDSEELKVGEWVIAIGSPFGLDYSVAAGIVSARGRSLPTEKNENYVPFIQTDVAINPGNSGGPLFNLEGEVVGINSQIYTRSGGSIGLSFAIPASVAQDVVAQIKEKGSVSRGWLGVAIQDVDKNLADSFGLDKPMGALVSQLEPDGPADKAGLKVGDIIVRFDGKPIEDSQAYRGFSRFAPRGRPDCAG
jgi:serine protease Do